jgi:hypothetical protein
MRKRLKFNRKRLHARLRKLRQSHHTRQKFVEFASKHGHFSIKYSHLRQFMRIVRTLNRLLVDAESITPYAKWLQRHHYGRFDAVVPEFNLPLLSDTSKPIAVKLYCNHSAISYIQFIAGKMELPFVEYRLPLRESDNEY